MKPVALIALFIGAAIGLYFPDIDRVFPFLLHRSGITHSVLIPFAVLWLTREQRPEWLRAVLIGVCLTLAVHLSFDLFPVLWMGYGLISRLAEKNMLDWESRAMPPSAKIARTEHVGCIPPSRLA